MKCAMILVLLAVSLLASAENFREKRNEVDLLTDGATPTREEIDSALKKAEAVMEEAIKEVEDPNTNVEEDAGEVKVPVRSTDDEAKPKRRGLIRIRASMHIGKK